MTDLERVRECIERRYGSEAERIVALELIDAHLEEDAEREAIITTLTSKRVVQVATVQSGADRIEQLEAELAEGQYRWRRTAELLREKNAELAELKEGHRVCEANMDAEIDRLTTELAELREAVRNYFEGEDPQEDRLWQLIEEES